MSPVVRVIASAACAALMVSGAAGAQERAQRESNGALPAPGTDSVVIRASTRYGANPFHRMLLGDNYRDLWAQPIKVPVLDLAKYAGGLTPLEEGGNAQTRNLHLRGADGHEYVFRPVFKEILELPDVWKGTVVADLFADGLSASHPAATVVSGPLLEAVDVMAPRPVLYVMPDDPRLGEFRDFAGKLGTMEQFPEDPDNGRGFGGAVDIINSDDLLEKMNADPSNRIDAHKLLTARLVDMVIGDNDRHPGQWKWARVHDSPDAPWVPIPRDRDKAFVSYEGAFMGVARKILPRLVTFGPVQPRALFYNAIEFDRRLLVSLDRADFDSTARAVVRALTDSVIDHAVQAMPSEYVALQPDLAEKIRSRRDNLPTAATGYYASLVQVVDLHASDAPDRAAIERHGDGSVRVALASAGRTYLDRRFVPEETREVRLYLHARDDTAVVTGPAVAGVRLYVVGGDGTNALVDSSTGGRGIAHIYENGKVGEVEGTDGKPAKGEFDPDTAWNRRPMVHFQGWTIAPFRDRGSSTHPVFGLKTGRGLGIMPTLGFSRRTYGFRQYPYASHARFEVGYSTALGGWEFELSTDNRIENSRMFLSTESEMTQLRAGRFSGFGNGAVAPDDRVIDVRQTQWRFEPAIGWALGPTTEVRLGPVVKYTTTDSVPGQVIADLRPYGFHPFGQVGGTLRFTHDSRPREEDGGMAARFSDEEPERGFSVEADAALYPGAWDATSSFGSLGGVVTGFVSLPLPLTPVLAARAGGKRMFGAFPYFEGAFLGGSESVRTIRRDQLVGDASVYGSVELRVPLARFAFIMPLNLGAVGFVDAGRVYVDGESPGGWHSGAGAGFWVGVLKTSTSLSLVFTNQRDRKLLVGTGFVF